MESWPLPIRVAAPQQFSMKIKKQLANVNQQALYFSDRPVRIAGHVKMDAYLKEWTAKAGKDNFGADPPNAMLSVYEPGQPDNTAAVVEITQPKIDGSDLVYNIKLRREVHRDESH
jgi:hypothetical protein